MISAHFVSDEAGFIRSVSIRGHADFAEAGSDPLCAAVTGMVTLVANTLTEVMGLSCEIRAAEAGDLKIALPEAGRERAKDLLCGLKVQLQDYQAQYPENIRVTAAHD